MTHERGFWLYRPQVSTVGDSNDTYLRRVKFYSGERSGPETLAQRLIDDGQEGLFGLQFVADDGGGGGITLFRSVAKTTLHLERVDIHGI